MPKYGVAVHGAGWVSGEHLKAYQNNPHCEVRVVSSRRAESAAARAAEAGLECDVSTDFDAVLARDDIDIVSICTPNHLHAEETIKAAQAGKHILIEKPVALTLDDLRAMRDAVREAKVKTVVGFVLRWNPLYQTIKALLADGAIGEVFYAGVDYLHEIGDWWSGWVWARTKEQGGTPMLLGGCHALDGLRWFAGEVAEVTAFNTRGHRDDFEYEPTTLATLKLANGGVGKCAASFEIEMPYTFNIELYGSKGSIRNNRLFSQKGKFPGQTNWIEIPTILPDSGEVSHHPFQGEIDHLVQCIIDDVESHVNLEDAVKTHEVCFAIDQSAANGGQPVRLPLLEG
jgi:predicted dehydrogenase